MYSIAWAQVSYDVDEGGYPIQEVLLADPTDPTAPKLYGRKVWTTTPIDGDYLTSLVLDVMTANPDKTYDAYLSTLAG